MSNAAEVWIWFEDQIDPPKLMIVDELIDATVLKTADAEHLSRKANETYTKYLWHPAPTRSPGKFVVRGQPRDAT